MTLSQYYDLAVKEYGFRSWNHYCAEVTDEAREAFKKLLKNEYKKLKKEKK